MDPEPPLWDRAPRLPPDAAPGCGTPPGGAVSPPEPLPPSRLRTRQALVVIGRRVRSHFSYPDADADADADACSGPRPGRPRPSTVRGNAESPSGSPDGLSVWLAVAVGFEPTVKLPPHTLSRRAPLAARTRYRGELYRTGGAGTKSVSGGRSRGAGQRWVSKKARSCAPHSSARTPGITSGRWFSRRSRITSKSEPAAPAFSSRAP